MQISTVVDRSGIFTSRKSLKTDANFYCCRFFSFSVAQLSKNPWENFILDGIVGEYLQIGRKCGVDAFVMSVLLVARRRAWQVVSAK